MKIAYIALRGIPLSDGIVQYTDDIARKLTEMEHEITVYTSRRYGNKTGLYDNCYYIKTVPSLPFGFAEKMSIVFMASLHQLFCNYDIVHYHAMGPSIFAFMGKLSKKVTVIQSHGVEYERAKHSRLTRHILYLLEKYSINMGDELLVCSNALYDHFMKEYGKKTKVIHNAVNIPIDIECDKDCLNEFGVKENEYYLFMARLTVEKGLHYLIKAFKKLKTDKKLVIAGPVDLKNSSHQKPMKMSERNSRLLFAGFVTGKKKENLLRGCYAFCLPSELEGFSVALLEAMSYRKCCVVSDIPNNLEAVGETGISFETNNTKALYSALQEAENSPNKVKELGRLAKQRVQEKFSWDIIAKETEQMYLQLLEKRKDKIKVKKL